MSHALKCPPTPNLGARVPDPARSAFHYAADIEYRYLLSPNFNNIIYNTLNNTIYI